MGLEDGITKTEERSPPVHSPDAEFSQELETMTIRNRNITFSNRKSAKSRADYCMWHRYVAQICGTNFL